MCIVVVIAGAGPNGLMLACELRLAGLHPIVLERRPEHEERQNRANGLVGQVVGALDRRGLYERLTDSAEPPHPSPGFTFGAMPLDLRGLEDNPLYLLPVPQYRIEQVLAERAAELGVEVRRGHELTALSQHDDGVSIAVTGPDGGYELRCCYLIGADGGHSIIRKLAGIDFPGVSQDDRVARFAHAAVPPEILDPVTGGLHVPGYGYIPPFQHHRTEHGIFLYAQLPDRPSTVATVEWQELEDDGTPLTRNELRASVRRVLGVDLPLLPPAETGETPVLRRTVGSNTRLAERYRAGRVLLLGDAAHVHSAMGGPGLNLGLQDALNLGWKLATVVDERAPEGLLETYETERRPAAERVVMHTQAQAALSGPGREVTALRELFTELLDKPDVAAHIANTMAGADIRYDMGPEAHPLAGSWAPDLTLHTAGGTVRLAELTRPARPLLIDMTDGASLAAELPGPGGHAETITGHAEDSPATALLLRPDCYIAWATSSPAPDASERATLQTALDRWITPPRVPSRAVPQT